jgi:HK97 family phage major capsid protein
MKTQIQPQIDRLKALIELESPSDGELSEMLDLTKQINEFQPEEKSDMNAPTELKTIAAVAEATLIEQVSKSMPELSKGGSFRTEIALKSLAISGTNTSNTGGTTIATPAQFAGFQPTVLPAKNRLYDLLPKRAANNAAVSFIQLGLTNASAKVKELALKPNSGIPATSVTKDIETFAHWVEISKQVMADASGLDAALAQLLVTGLISTVDSHIYSTLATGATIWTPTLKGTDIFAEAAVALESNGAQSVCVLVNPADYLEAATAKASTSGEYLGMSPMSPTNVIASSAVPKGNILAFDQNAVTFFERELAAVQIGYHGDQFVRNAATLLCEMRGLAAVLNPALVLAGALPATK